MNAIPKPLKGMPLKFDYKYLDSEKDHIFLKQAQKEIYILLGSRDKNVFRIGELLATVKNMLSQKLFASWANTELSISDGSAQRYIKIATRLKDRSAQLDHLPYWLLNELAKPSVPEAFIDRIASGEIVPTWNNFAALKENFQESLEIELETEGELQPIMIHSEQEKSQEATIRDLASQLARMQQQINTLSPEVQIKEVEKHVIPQEVQEELATLRKELDKYYTAWEEVIKDRKAAIEENQRLTQERDVLLENWKVVSQKCRELEGKIKNMISSKKRFDDEYKQIQQAGVTISDSVLARNSEGDN